MNLYEGMFLLDNALVREDWKKAKGTITGALAKHGCTLKTARRWGERKLAYSIRGKQRATFVLTYFEQPADTITTLRRDLELNERVLRYLILKADEVPAAEFELAQAEEAADFVVPAPPPDDLDEGEGEGETRIEGPNDLGDDMGDGSDLGDSDRRED